jgi:hypothetical protein
MILALTVEKKAVTGEGRPYNYYTNIEIDLVRDNVAEFLAQIPDDLPDHSSIMITIQREDGDRVSYVDGMSPESQGYGWGQTKRISEIDNGEYADALRHTAKLFAERRAERLKETEQAVSPSAIEPGAGESEIPEKSVRSDRALPSFHDDTLVGYEVDGEARRIVLRIRNVQDKSLHAVVFSGVEGYCFINAALSSILFHLEQVSTAEVLSTYEAEIVASFRQSGAPGAWAGDLEAAATAFRQQGVHGFLLSSSFGMSGWIIARQAEVAIA